MLIRQVDFVVRDSRYKHKEGTEKAYGIGATDNELRYRNFIENNIDGAWRLDLERPIPLELPAEEQVNFMYCYGFFGEANQALAKQYGFDTPEEIIGFRLAQFMPPDSPTSIPALIQVVDSKYRIENWQSNEQDRFGNRKVFLNNLEGEIKDGCLVRVWGTAKDITRQYHLEEEIKLRSKVFEQIPDGCVIVEMPSETVVYANRAFQQITGHEMAECTGKKMSFLLGADTDPDTVAAQREAIAQQRPFLGEVLNYKKDGAPFWNFLRISPLTDAEGLTTHYVGILTDVTELKAIRQKVQDLTAQLAHVTRVDTMGALTAAFAHEMNQPLAAILSNAQAGLRFLEREPSELDDVRDALKALVVDAKRAGEIMRRTRRLVKLEKHSSEHLDVNRLVEEVCEVAGNDMAIRRVAITKQLAPDLPAVTGDPIQLQQVILNLLLNASQAAKALEAGKRRIILATRLLDERFIEIRVTDFGPGIDESLLDRIFEPFFTTKQAGMGMGLAISRTIVEAHGGRLSAENRAHQGASFRVVLPGEASAVSK